MPDDTLNNAELIEHRVRERAFSMWQEAGCPEGRADEFWHRARDVELGLRLPAETQIDQAGEDSFPASDPTNFASF